MTNARDDAALNKSLGGVKVNDELLARMKRRWKRERLKFDDGSAETFGAWVRRTLS